LGEGWSVESGVWSLDVGEGAGKAQRDGIVVIGRVKGRTGEWSAIPMNATMKETYFHAREPRVFTDNRRVNVEETVFLKVGQYSPRHLVRLAQLTQRPLRAIPATTGVIQPTPPSAATSA